MLEEGRIEELQRKEFISSLKASIQQHVEKHQLDAFTVAGLQDDIKLLESQWVSWAAIMLYSDFQINDTSIRHLL
ncbi:hypothetical protein EON65_09135 [archaeon]|nr:MAG: hypothetical protein EON65_09135 [archaeon]